MQADRQTDRQTDTHTDRHTRRCTPLRRVVLNVKFYFFDVLVSKIWDRNFPVKMFDHWLMHLQLLVYYRTVLSMILNG